MNHSQPAVVALTAMFFLGGCDLAGPIERLKLDLKINLAEGDAIEHSGDWTLDPNTEEDAIERGLTIDNGQTNDTVRTHGFFAPGEDPENGFTASFDLDLTGNQQSLFRLGPLAPRTDQKYGLLANFGSPELLIGRVQVDAVVEDVLFENGTLLSQIRLEGAWGSGVFGPVGTLQPANVQSGEYEGSLAVGVDCTEYGLAHLPKMCAPKADPIDNGTPKTSILIAEPDDSVDCPAEVVEAFVSGDSCSFNGSQLELGGEPLRCQDTGQDTVQCLGAMDSVNAAGCTWKVRAVGFGISGFISGMADDGCDTPFCGSAFACAP
jgi:hypothetical protein